MGLVSEKTISDPLENPKMQVISPSLAMGLVVEQALPPEAIEQSSPAVEQVPLVGAIELLRPGQESSVWVKES